MQMKDLFRILQWAVGLRSPRREFLSGEIDPAVLLEIRYKTAAEKNKVSLDTPLMKGKFVVFDLETTGLYPFSGDEITSVSAVVIENGQLRKDLYFDQLVNPQREIPPIATEITGITNEMVENAPTVLWVLNEFLDFARNCIMAAHNADFDFNFINLKLKQYCHTKMAHHIVDTFILANALLTGKNCQTLDALIKFYNLSPEGRHTSLGDALVTAEILLEFFKILAKRNIHTLGDLYNYLHWRSFQ